MRRGGHGTSALKVDLMVKLVAWSGTGVKLFVLAFVVSVAYIVYGIYGGHLRGAIEPRVMRNIQLMGQVMALSGGLGTICLVIITFDEVAFAVVAGMVGLGLVFGFPLLVAGQLDQGGARAADVILRWSSVAGQFIVLVVGVRILIEIINYILQAPQRQARIAGKQGIEGQKKSTSHSIWKLQRCWEMPYCHEAIREVCPAYKVRNNCWRIRQGCNCDPTMIEALIRAGGATRGKGDTSSGKLAQEAYLRSDLEADIKLGEGERTRECKNCPIFNEHQRQKFNLLNPIIIVAAIAGLLAAYPIMQKLYVVSIIALSSLASQMTYGVSESVSQWIGRLDSPAVWIFFYIIVGLVVMSYVLKFVEWAILVKKM